MDERNWVQQITQINKSPAWEAKERIKGEKKALTRTRPRRRATFDKNHWTGQQNTELQSNQTEAGTALATAMAALYYCFGVGLFLSSNNDYIIRSIMGHMQ